MSFEVTVTPTVYDVDVSVNPSVQPFDVEVTVGNVPDLDLTTNGDSGASTFDSLTGELNIPEYTLDGLGGVPESRTITINGTTQDLSADRTFTIPTHDPVTIGSPANGLAIDGNQVLTIGLASVSQAGALSSTDWSTFNNKQNAIGYTPENVANKAINFTSPDDTKYPTTLAVSTALAGKQDVLTNPITGTGVAGQVSFWTGTGTQSGDSKFTFNSSTGLLTLDGDFEFVGAQILRTSTGNLTLSTGGGNGNIILTPNGIGNVGIGTTSPSVKLHISETGAGNMFVAIQKADTTSGNSISLDFVTSNSYVPTVTNFGGRLRYTRLGSNSVGDWDIMSADSTGAAVSRFKIFNGGNVLIQNGGTFTDAGFRLDVKGTARVQSQLSVNTTVTTARINVATANNTAFFQALNDLGNTTIRLLNAGTPSRGQIYIDDNGINQTLLNASGTSFFGGGGLLVNTKTAIPSAVLVAESTTKGFLPPRMTGAQAEAISSPAEGLLVYSTDGTGTTITSKGWWGFNGSTWAQLN